MNNDTLTKILELARWAPSGDNTQPWRFEVLNEMHLRVHCFDTQDRILYDYDGHPSHIAHGALLETIRIAASGFGLKCKWFIYAEGSDRSPCYDVIFTDSPNILLDPLFASITRRTVQRRPMESTPLTQEQRHALRSALGDDFKLQIFDSLNEKIDTAKLLWYSAKIRLTCPEAYLVHKEVIEWRARFSKDRIPEQAVGVDPMTARLMEWVMQSWSRVSFFNRYLLGTVVPRIQLDLLPGLLCAAHLLVRPQRPPSSLEDWIRLGMAVQRMWLTATHMGLHLQPQMTPIIFRWYARSNRSFSTQDGIFNQTLQVANRFERLADAQYNEDFSFFARVGISEVPQSRSTRLDLEILNKKHSKLN